MLRFFGKKVFGDAIKLRILMGDYPGLGPKWDHSHPYESQRHFIHTEKACAKR